MGTVIVGVAGTLLGVLFGGALQHLQASQPPAATGRRPRQAETGRVRRVPALDQRELRPGDGGAADPHRGRPAAHAVTAEIEVLAGREVSGPARELTGTIIDVHSKLAEGDGVEQTTLAEVDRRRLEVVVLFKADLGIAEA